MLNAQEVTVRFSRHAPPILDRLDFSFAQGSRIAIMGPSGCGKSTLQRVLTGLQSIDGGRITLDDAAQPDARDRAARRGWHRTILMLPQDTARIFNPALRLRSQFRSCLALHGIGDDETDRDRVAVETLQGCDVPAAALDRHADGLSGGQRQRAALARLLCLKPRFLLLDEPTAALDPATARDLLDLVLGLQRHQGFGLLLSTHDTKIARRADLVYDLVDGRLTAQA